MVFFQLKLVISSNSRKILSLNRFGIIDAVKAMTILMKKLILKFHLMLADQVLAKTCLWLHHWNCTLITRNWWQKWIHGWFRALKSKFLSLVIIKVALVKNFELNLFLVLFKRFNQTIVVFNNILNLKFYKENIHVKLNEESNLY